MKKLSNIPAKLCLVVSNVTAKVCLVVLLFTFTFHLSPVKAQTENVLYTMTGSTGGENPVGNVIFSATGDTLLGLSCSGGIYGYGSIYCFSLLNNQYTDLVDFDAGSGDKGRNPYGHLLLLNHKLYGMTEIGGAHTNGVIFSYNLHGGAYTDLVDFNNETSPDYGKHPYGSLIAIGNTLYGVTSGGGISSANGNIFSYDTATSVFANIFTFINSTTGETPECTLTASVTGDSLFGTCAAGGANGYGCVFSVTISGANYHDLLDFNYITSAPYGANPQLSTLILSGRTLYGATPFGGANDSGTVFSVKTDGTLYSDLVDFTGYNGPYNGNVPVDLILSGNTLFGMTAEGGNGTSYGCIYSIDLLNGAYTDLFNFNGTNGYYPSDALTPHNNTFYATTQVGGVASSESGFGNIFSFTPACTLAATAKMTNCYTSNNGIAQATVSGGTTPYTYKWVNASSTVVSTSNPTSASLSAGSYTLTVTDNTAICTATALVTIAALAANATGTNPLCNGGSGSAQSVPTGGTSPYTYTWQGGATASSISSLSAGTYTLTVHDANNCSAAGSISISQPTAVSITIASQVNELCNGTSAGSATANAATGGTLYTDLLDFNGTNGSTPEYGSLTLSGTTFYGMTQEGGAHNDGCVFSFNTSGNVYTDLLDFNGTNGKYPFGSLTLSGTTLYGMTIEGGADNAGCVFSISTTGTNYADLLDFNGTNGADPEGSLILSGTTLYGMTEVGGAHNEGCVFSISTTGTNYADLLDFNGTNGENPLGSLILSGTTLYGMTPEGGAHNDGCVFSISTTGTNYADLLDFNGTNGQYPRGSLILSGTTLYGVTYGGGAHTVGCVFSISTTGTNYADLLDFNGTNGEYPQGSLTLSGTTLYGMTLEGGAHSDGNVFSISTTGTNYADLLDFNGTNGENPFGSLILSGTTLYGMTEVGGAHNDGVVFSLTTTGYSYNWTPSGGTNLTASNLSAGTYTITATNGNSCTVTASVNITQPAAIVVNASVLTNVNCNGNSTGSAQSAPSSGISPYTYSWSTGALTSSVSNLAVGAYSVYVQDANGCTASGTATITQPAALVANATGTNPLCNGGTGSAQSVPTGGTSPYTYTWQGGATASSISSLSVGTYTLTVNDANNCSATSSINITQPNVLLANATGANPLCNGGTGSAQSVPTGGTSPYTYTWQGGATTSSISSLSAGTYTLTVHDANNCSAAGSISISQPTAVSITIASQVNELCNGTSAGSATANAATGGTLYTDLLDFNGTNGQDPQGSLTLSGTTFYGMTQEGGAHNDGCIFSFNTSGNVYTDLLDFNGTNGASPEGSLILSGTTLYGMTEVGGAHSDGCIFSFNTSGNVYTDLLDFNGTNGEYPLGSLILSGTTMYGMTIEGGAHNEGCVFSISTTGTNYADLLDFNGTNGENPLGSLILSGTTLYGMTQAGGAHSDGCVFSISTTGTNYADLLDFNGTNGQYPLGSLILSGTTLYGMTLEGGAHSYGCIFSFNTSGNVYTDLLDFNGTNGENPQGSLTLSGTTLYGMTEVGGAHSDGCVFSISTTGTNYADLLDFNGTNGKKPYGSLTLSGTTLYGMTEGGGAHNDGVVFSLTTTGFSYNWTPSGGTNLTASNLSAGTYTITATNGNSCTGTASVNITQPAAIVVNASVLTNVNCNGNSTCSAQSVPSGGTSPYTYSWSTGALTSSVSSLALGTYSVYVQDANGCTASGTANITQPAALVANATGTNPLCNGGTGSAQSVPTGGTSPYTYTWQGGATASSISSLSVGTYTLTVNDANNCSATSSINITQPNVLLANATGTNPLCNGGSGSAQSVPTGGTSPYTYTWQGGATASSISSLSVGTYTLTVNDANNCSATASINITQPNVLLANATGTNPLCNGGSGSAQSVPTGGTSPYTYTWQGGATTSSISSLSVGTFTLTVNDANNCSATSSINITQPNVLLANATGANPLCIGGTGSAQSVPTGGTSPYTYTWQGGATTSSISSLSAGTYTLTVHDANNCSAAGSISISQPTAVSITIASQVNELCNGTSAGSATANAATGGTLYTDLLDFNGTNGQYPLGSLILSGTTLYGMTEIGGAHNDGCVFSFNTSGNVYTDLLDFNGTNGAAPEGSLILSGTTLYGMTEVGGAFNAGCVFSISTTGTNYADLLDFNSTNGEYPRGSLILSGMTLYGMTEIGGAHSDGCVFSISTTGTNYADLLDFNGTNGENPRGSLILSGTTLYGMTIEGGADNDGCVFSISTTGTNYADLLDFNGTNGENPLGSLILSGTTLYGMTNGGGAHNEGCVFSISAAGTNYADLLDFNGTNGENPRGSLILSGTTLYGMTLEGGAHSDGCVFSISTTGTNYADLLDFNGTNGENPFGSLILSGTTMYGMTYGGGAHGDGLVFSLTTTGYSYNWTPSGGTNLTASNLSAGTYTITATNGNSCTGTASVNITQPAAIVVNASVLTNVNCNGNSTGSAQSVPSGGTSPYTYSWSTGALTSSVSSLALGTYSVYVQDANGCTASGTANITQPTALAANATETSVSCNGGNNGSAQSAPSGGTSPYTYAWQGGATTSSVTNLSAGTFTLTVNDANNCSATSSVIITQPMVLNGHEAITSQVLCYGYSDGSMTSATTGGTPPYTYLWSNGATTTSISGLPPDAYKLIVTDSNGCYYSWTEVISQPGMLRDSIVSTTIYDISCNGGNNGGAKVGVKGGTLFYTYSWGPVSCSTANISGLSAGTYSVFVTDKNGCSLTAAIITLTQPASLSGSLTSSTSPTCNGNNGGATIGVSGGTSPYTYIWTPRVSTLATATGLSAGSYTVEIRDKNHCISDFDFLLTQSSSVRDSIAVGSIVEILCNGTNIGSATVGVKNGVTPYTYLWSPGGETQATVSNLSAGTYIINITDKNGCTGSTSVTITQPSSLSDSIVSSTVSNITCNGENNGRARVGAQGGKIPYTYSWAPVSCSTAIISGLSAGTYSVYVTDKNGCSASAAFVSITITQPALLSGSVAGSTSPTCNGGDNGTATIGVNGGTTPYTYLWTPRGSTTAFGSGLKAGAYTVEVTDKNQCHDYISFTITQPLAIRDSIVAASKVNVLCEGSSTGSATVGAKLGVSPYTYLWSPGGGTNQTESSLSAGAYTVTVTDANGCTATATTTITQPTMLRDSIATQSCSANTGMATVGVKGGKTPYTYSWNPGGGSKATMSGLSNGSYIITITDNNGCSKTKSVTFLCAVAPPRGDGPVAPDTCCPGEDLSGIKLYPNPNTGEFRIEGVQAGQIVQLYDYTGRLLKTETAESSPMLLNISNQANGVYLVRILSKDGVLVSEKKVVKTQ